MISAINVMSTLCVFLIEMLAMMVQKRVKLKQTILYLVSIYHLYYQVVKVQYVESCIVFMNTRVQHHENTTCEFYFMVDFTYTSPFTHFELRCSDSKLEILCKLALSVILYCLGVSS